MISKEVILFGNEFQFNQDCINNDLVLVEDFFENIKKNSNTILNDEKLINDKNFDEIREILINNKSYSELLFLNRKYSLLDSINSLIVSLEDFDEFYDEYFDLLRIQEITEYILNMRYDDITLENIIFIQDLYDLFFNVLSFKINLIKKYDFKIENNFEDEYLIEYLKFKNEFHKRDYYFLKNILKIDYHNKDELINYCKFMKE